MPITRPLLQHPELYPLFEHGLEIPDSVLDPILALPRESLRADLETLVGFAMDTDIENQEETDQDWFPFHALMLLGELRSQQNLPLVLDMLRKPDDHLCFWFGAG